MNIPRHCATPPLAAEEEEGGGVVAVACGGNGGGNGQENGSARTDFAQPPSLPEPGKREGGRGRDREH